MSNPTDVSHTQPGDDQSVTDRFLMTGTTGAGKTALAMTFVKTFSTNTQTESTMTKAHSFIISALVVMLSGCAGMNSDFEFDRSAKDSGVWMSQADDISAGSSGNAPSAAGGFTGAGIRLDDYRLLDTGTIRLDPQTDTQARRSGLTDAVPLPVASSGGVLPFTRENGVLHTTVNQTAYCSAAHCFPEPAAAFRRPDGVARIWIAPYVSPDNNVHMGEVIYSVSRPGDWNGILM